MRPYLMFPYRAALFEHQKVIKDGKWPRPNRPRPKFNRVPKELHDLELRPMTLHPILDKIFHYEDDKIVELLNEHTLNEMKYLWHEKVPFEVKNQFKQQHKGGDIAEVLRYLCTK